MAATAELDLSPADLAPPLIATLAGLAQIAAGLVVAASGVQLWAFVTFYSWWLVPVPYLIAAVGTLAMVLGGLTTRARFWATAAGTVVGLGMAALMSVWTMFALYNGMISAMAVMATLFAIAGAMLMPFALLPVRKTDQARRALYA